MITLLWLCLLAALAISILASLTISIVSLIQSSKSKSKSKSNRSKNGSTGAKGNNGINGSTGQQGPALFNMYNYQGQAILGSNTISSDSNAATLNDIIRTIETYPTSFLTFRLASFGTIGDPFLIGLVNTNNINTFAFGLQFDNGNLLSKVANQSGSISAGTHATGDIFTVVVTSSNYFLIQNGSMIGTGTNTVVGGSYYANFFLANPNVSIDLISFGFQS